MSKPCPSCTRQVARLENKPYYAGLSKLGIVEMIDVLHRYAHARAGEVIDEAQLRTFGDGGNDCVPTPAQLWALCRMDSREFITVPAAPAPAPYRSPNRSCSECRGLGFAIIERADGLSGARRCSSGCPVPTCGGDGGSATPFNYKRERKQLTPHRPGVGSVKMRDIRDAVQAVRQ